jgi:hypothetical protein
VIAPLVHSSGAFYFGVEMPTKEQVREWLRKEVEAKRPPPDMKEIRRQLGWNLIEASRKVRVKR